MILCVRSARRLLVFGYCLMVYLLATTVFASAMLRAAIQDREWTGIVAMFSVLVFNFVYYLRVYTSIRFIHRTIAFHQNMDREIERIISEYPAVDFTTLNDESEAA